MIICMYLPCNICVILSYWRFNFSCQCSMYINIIIIEMKRLKHSFSLQQCPILYSKCKFRNYIITYIVYFNGLNYCILNGFNLLSFPWKCSIEIYGKCIWMCPCATSLLTYKFISSLFFLTYMFLH